MFGGFFLVYVMPSCLRWLWKCNRTKLHRTVPSQTPRWKRDLIFLLSVISCLNENQRVLLTKTDWTKVVQSDFLRAPQLWIWRLLGFGCLNKTNGNISACCFVNMSYKQLVYWYLMNIFSRVDASMYVKIDVLLHPWCLYPTVKCFNVYAYVSAPSCGHGRNFSLKWPNMGSIRAKGPVWSRTWTNLVVFK